MDLTSPFPFRHQRTVHMPKPLEISVNPIQEQTGRNPSDSDTNENPSQSKSVPPSLRLDISDYPMDQSENEFEQPSPESSLQITTSSFRPRSPLPPSKLANIANALGVNTPMPATYVCSPSPTTFRSPSRYLLHIVPPSFLPSDDDDDPTLSSSPNGASAVSVNSYRSQFRRGTLVPLYPTLRSQLGAIAREYSLPSTGGLVLYLAQTAPDGSNDGPRISDEVWKLLWYRALMAERQEQLGIAGTSRAPSSLALRSGSGNMTPLSVLPSSSNSEFPSSLSSLSTTPTPTPLHVVYPPDVPSDTETSTSTSTSNPSPSTVATTTGFTSFDHDSTHMHSHPDLHAIASDLTPNPFLPILAKVEFDIDLRKAKWYDSWLKSRKERAKWKANVNGNNNASSDSDSKVVPLPLELPDLAKSRSRFNSLNLNSDEERENNNGRAAALHSIGYALLDGGGDDVDGDVDGDAEPDLEKTAVEDDDDGEVDMTVRMRIPSDDGKSGVRDPDPLADVFGNDSDTWSAMRHENPDTRKTKPRDPALIITDDGGADYDGNQDEPKDGNAEEEVLKLWNEHSKPTLKLVANGSSNATPVARRPAPPPLKIAPPPSAPSGTEAQAHNFRNGPRSALPVMQRSFSETVVGENISAKRMKHHTGIVFGDGEGLGFGSGVRVGRFVEEPLELAEKDEGRSSQVIMKHKLDVIEKQLAKLSPRKLDPPSPSPPLPPLPPLEKLAGSSPSPSRKEKEGMSTSPSPSPSASPQKRLSVHKRGRSSMSSTSSTSRSHLEHQFPQLTTHGQHNSKGSKSLITPPLNSSVKSTGRSPPHVTVRPASGAVSVASGSGSSSIFNNAVDGMTGNGITNGNGEIDDGQDLIILPSTRGSSMSSAPNGAPITVPDSPPLLPLSPDPFGRRTMEDGMRMPEHTQGLPNGSVQPLSPSTFATSPLEFRPLSNASDTNETLRSIAMTLNQSPGEKQASRFSADSEQSIEAAGNANSKQKQRPRTNSIMSVRGLRNLWRKSAASNSGSSSSSIPRSAAEPPLPVPPLPPVDRGLPTPPLSGFASASTSGSSSITSRTTLSQHSREESLASVKSLSRAGQPPQPQLRPRRPSASPTARPDSGGDPFQFDSVLYKSPSTPNMLGGVNSPGSVNPTNHHKPGAGSVGSKGILKNWTGGNPTEAEARKMRIHQQHALGLRRPSESRPESTASAASDRSVSDPRRSVPSPPPSPPKARRSTSQSRLLQLSELANPRMSLNSNGVSHSLPTAGTLASLSRLNEISSPLASPNGLIDESFEVVPSRRLTPSASYSGDIL